MVATMSPVDAPSQAPKKLRVGIFVPWITSNRGGTEAVGSLVANSMAGRGHEVFVYTFDDAQGQSTWPLDDAITLRHFAEKPSDSNDDLLIARLREDRLDVLMGLHMNRQFYRYIYYANALGVPVVLSEHINPAHPREIGTFTEEEREAVFSGADRIHLILEDYLDTLPPWLRSRARVIPNAVPLASRGADVRGETEPRILLSVARLVPRKNLDTLIEAFAIANEKVQGWRLEIAGDGNMEGDLLRRIDALGLAGKVELLGRITETYPLYERSQLFALPSYTEGFPLTSLEAMAHGLPVVGFKDCSGLNVQVLDEESGLLVEREDQVQSLADALVRLMEDDDLRVRLGEGSRERSRRYDPERIGDEWESMLIEAAGGAGEAALSERIEPRVEALSRLRWMLKRGPEHYHGPMIPGGRRTLTSEENEPVKVRLADGRIHLGHQRYGLTMASLRKLRARDFVEAVHLLARSREPLGATVRDEYAHRIQTGLLTKRAAAADVLRHHGGVLRARLPILERFRLLAISLLGIGRRDHH